MRARLGTIMISISACAPSIGACTTGGVISDEAQTSAAIQDGDKACGFALSGDSWRNGDLPQRAGHFTITFQASAYENGGGPIDAVIGLANGHADGFSDLGPIVRFNAAGQFDARSGSGYTATTALLYRASAYGDDPITYVIRMDVDIPSHRYSVWVTPPGGSEVQIARDFAFRSEQSAMARIDTIAAFVDSPTGYVFFCGTTVSPPFCITSNQGSGWVGTPFPTQRGHLYLVTDLTASANTLDAVVGLSAGTPRAFTDLGPIVRLNPAGYFDARDGDTYRYAMYAPVHAGYQHSVFFDVDVPTHQYSAHVTEPDGSWPEVAYGYAFRTEQRAVDSLSQLGQVIDGTPGTIATCDLMLEWP